MSAMCFSVVPLPGSTFRMNLAVTQAFNADFDGDEMVRQLLYALYCNAY